MSHARPRAFTLLELLIGMSISALLLMAVAAALQASARAVAVNQDAFASTQIARAAIDRLSAEVRCADAVDANDAGDVLRIIRSPGQRQPDEAYREFSYDAVGHRIILKIFHADGGANAPLPLANTVDACRFSAIRMPEPHGDPIRIDLAITCATGRASTTLNASTAPRRTMR